MNCVLKRVLSSIPAAVFVLVGCTAGSGLDRIPTFAEYAADLAGEVTGTLTGTAVARSCDDPVIDGASVQLMATIWPRATERVTVDERWALIDFDPSIPVLTHFLAGADVVLDQPRFVQFNLVTVDDEVSFLCNGEQITQWYLVTQLVQPGSLEPGEWSTEDIANVITQTQTATEFVHLKMRAQPEFAEPAE